jgi:DNA-binding CsgD family transcriptional regulator
VNQALLLSDGHSSKEIANDVGVTQIKSIFSKTGVRRQSDLVRLLLSNAQATIQAGP